ncbi:MAG TPA: tryptophan-rich sensory protein [Candidatus Scatomorpha merdigallinarum]|nr:tryptophan-rich sensory protein [Candidatus Scatomorpha merdigallinarum]
MKSRWKPMLAALAIPLLFGGLGALLAGGMGDFEQLAKPPLTPPGWVFPLVWTLLYLAMGWASGRVYLIRHPVQVRRRALKLYAVQLVMNALWPLLFFRLGLYWVSALWLAILTLLVVMTAGAFGKLDDLAGILLVPYAAWCLFALYLNIGVAALNA